MVHASDFAVIALSDTQVYSREFSPIFAAQTQWIVNNRASKNIVYVAHLGDVVENANLSSEWDHANLAMSLLENPDVTGLLHGIPHGIAVGNHEENPEGNPAGNSTLLYNTYFGESRFLGRTYHGAFRLQQRQSFITFRRRRNGPPPLRRICIRIGTTAAHWRTGRSCGRRAPPG